MLLSAKQLRVALVTTHIPLDKVTKSITKRKIIAKATILNEDLKLKLKVKVHWVQEILPKEVLV